MIQALYQRISSGAIGKSSGIPKTRPENVYAVAQAFHVRRARRWGDDEKGSWISEETSHGIP